MQYDVVSQTTHGDCYHFADLSMSIRYGDARVCEVIVLVVYCAVKHRGAVASFKGGTEKLIEERRFALTCAEAIGKEEELGVVEYPKSLGKEGWRRDWENRRRISR